MNDDGIKTYFLWLTEEEQSDLFSYEDSSGVSSLICESVMEQHESLPSDYEYVEKPVAEYSNNETMHIPNMHPETTNVATTYSYDHNMIPPNLFYNSPGINHHQYQTTNPNTTEFNPMYYENPSKDVTSVNSFAVPSAAIETSSVVPSTMSFIESNPPPVIEYSNDVSSLSNEMEHVPSNPIQNYSVPNEMPSPVQLDNDGPSEDLHMVSVLLNVPLNQLSTDPVPGQEELRAESVDFNDVPHEMSMIPDDTSIGFNHERLSTLDNNDSNIIDEYPRTVDSSEYHDDSSRSMVIDEDPTLSENCEPADQTVPENVATSHCAMTEDEVLSPACVTNEITIDESEPNNATEENSAVEDEPTNNNEEKEESSSRTEAEDESCEVTNQVNGTIYDVENEVPAVQICIRTGCANPAVNNPEWEQEFCSNDCVVIHCRNVFDAWVEANAVMSQ